MWKLSCSATEEQALAKLGDLLTPERYIEEHRLLEVLDRTIDRSLKRLMDLQAAAAKKAGSNISSLQPGWATRKG